MSSYNDDNFGNWDNMDDPDMRAFYDDCQKKSVKKICVCCGREVRILPQYDKCDPCTTKIEQGFDI